MSTATGQESWPYPKERKKQRDWPIIRPIVTDVYGRVGTELTDVWQEAETRLQAIVKLWSISGWSKPTPHQTLSLKQFWCCVHSHSRNWSASNLVYAAHYVLHLLNRDARSPVFYGSSRISGLFSRLPFETNTGDTFSCILNSLNFVVWFTSVTNILATLAISATVLEIFTVKDRKLLISPTPSLFDDP